MLARVTRERRTSINDVAAAAGVSATTVSDALSGKGRLPEETRARVREIAERLGYRPNALARGLRSQQVGLLGFVLIPMTSASMSTVAYWTTLMSNAAEASLGMGYALVLLPPDAEALSPMRFPVDGVIVVDPLRDDKVLASLRQQGVAAVTVGRDLSGGSEHWVDDDLPQGSRKLLDEIARPGERIALVTFPAMKSYLQDAISGVVNWPGHAAGCPIVHTVTTTQQEEMDLVVARIVADPPDLLLGANDRISLALLRGLKAAGVKVPGDLRLASLVDAPELERSKPPVTALVQHPAESGRTAVSLLVELVEGRTTASSTLIPMALSIRSTAPSVRPTRARSSKAPGRS